MLKKATGLALGIYEDTGSFSFFIHYADHLR